MGKKRVLSESEDSNEDSENGNVENDRNSNTRDRTKIQLGGNGVVLAKEEDSLSKRKTPVKRLDKSISSKESPETKKMAKGGKLESPVNTSNSKNPTEKLVMKTLFEESEELENTSESSSSEEESEEKGKGRTIVCSNKKRDINSSKSRKRKASSSSDTEDSEEANDDGVHSNRNSKNKCRRVASSDSSSDDVPLKSILDDRAKRKSVTGSRKSSSAGIKRKRENESESTESESSDNEIRETKRDAVKNGDKNPLNIPLKRTSEENNESCKLSRETLAKNVKHNTSSSEEDGEGLDRITNRSVSSPQNVSRFDDKEEGSSDSEQSSESGDERKGKVGKGTNLAKKHKSESCKADTKSQFSSDESIVEEERRKSKSDERNSSSSDDDESSKRKKNRKSESSDPNSDDDSSQEKRGRKSKSNERGGKKITAGEKKFIRMKRLVLMAGIRIGNHSNFFAGCKSTTAKVKKMVELLEEKGLKGRPTIEKCKKLRKKLEKQREIAELDLGNIIEGGTRSRRGKTESKEERNKKEEIESLKQRFSRIKDIVSSESD